MLELDVKLSLQQFNLSAALALDSPVTAFFGPAGAGKSTLLGVIAGTVTPQRGWIKLGGEVLFDASKGIRIPFNQRRIGFVSRNPVIYPHLSVRSYLLDAVERTPSSDRHFSFDEIVSLLDLEILLDRHPQQLSGIEKQRVALAHALLGAPRLLLMDETNKDLSCETSISPIVPFLTRVRDTLGIPVIYVTNSLSDVLQLTDKMVLMANGRVLGVGDINRLIAEQILAANSSLQVFDNLLPVTIRNHETETGCTIAYYYGIEVVLPIAPHLKINGPTRISVKSNNIALSKSYLTGISIQNQIKGRICAIIRSSEQAIVQIDCGTTLLAGVSLKALQEMDLHEGDRVYCLIKAHAFSYVAESVEAAEAAEPQSLEPVAANADIGLMPGPVSPTKH